MDIFDRSSWANENFANNYLEKADIYIVERQKMIGIMSSLCVHFFHDKKCLSILDLGCGDGVLTEELLKTDTSINATLVDGSKAMLQRAKERLSAFRDIDYIEASFQQILDSAAKLSEYDFCISSHAIHHLEMKEKAALFRYIFNHLSVGGHFLNIDVVLPPSKALENWYFTIWKQWMRSMMDQLDSMDELPEDIIKKYQSPSSMNKPDTLEDQLESLKESGFSEVDCYYKNGIFVVFGGKKT